MMWPMQATKHSIDNFLNVRKINIVSTNKTNNILLKTFYERGFMTALIV